MKKILVYTTLMLTVVSGLVGCAGEEDDIFSASAAERLNEASDKYSARLMAQPNGWAMQYYPTYADASPQGSGYLILMDFDEDFSVKVAMDNRFTSNVYAEDRSPWEVITDNGPVLSFNGFNSCMHAFSDPEDIPWTSDNEQSEGCGGDYEFIIVDAPEDASYMMLKGKKHNTYNLLTPIEQGVDYAEYLADVKAFHNSKFRETELVGLLMHFGDSIYRMDSSNDGLPNIYPDGSDAIANESFHPFLVTKRGNDYYVRFRDVFKRDDMEGTLQELRYDSIAQEFVGSENSAWRITGYPAPRFYDETIRTMHTWSVPKAGDMSDKFRTYIDQINSSFAAMKDNRNRSYTFIGLSFGQSVVASAGVRDTAYCWNVVYRSPGSTRNQTAVYRFTTQITPDAATNVQFGYQEPRDVASQNVANTIPVIVETMQELSRQFIITAASSNYDLSTLKFQAADDPDLWFVMNY